MIEIPLISSPTGDYYRQQPRTHYYALCDTFVLKELKSLPSKIVLSLSTTPFPDSKTASQTYAEYCHREIRLGSNTYPLFKYLNRVIRSLHRSAGIKYNEPLTIHWKLEDATSL